MFLKIQELVQKIASSPMTLFIHGIFIKFYVIIITAGVVAAYWILKGLYGLGAIDYAEKVLTEVSEDTKAIAQHCIPKIGSLTEFMKCLSDPPKYDPSIEPETKK